MGTNLKKANIMAANSGIDMLRILAKKKDNINVPIVKMFNNSFIERFNIFALTSKFNNLFFDLYKF